MKFFLILIGSILPLFGSANTVILIHGHKSHPAQFKKLERFLTSKDFKVDYFTYQSDRLTLTQASSELEIFLKSCAPTHEKVILIAHSMGGLVAKKALNSFSSNTLHATFITLGTPYGGFHRANLVYFTPFGRYFSKWFKTPMSYEIASNSFFLQKLAETRLSKKIQWFIIDSPQDEVASPYEESEKRNYQRFIKRCSAHYTLKGLSHMDFLEPVSRVTARSL